MKADERGIAEIDAHRARRVAQVVKNEPGTDTEDGLAITFAKQNPGLRWVQDWHRWMRWDGQLWVQDRVLHVYDRVRGMLGELSAIAADRERSRLGSAQTVAAVERLARSDRHYAATPDDFDRDPMLLNTPSGTVNLRGGSCQPHDQADELTKIAAIGPEGECPRWLKFLDEITGCDVELIGFLQRMVGYMLTGSTNEHALFFAWGVGANGKSTFANVLYYILRDYAAVAPIETFTESHGERHPTDLAMLRGARLVIASETDEGRPWSESRIKLLTGGDPVTARFMRGDFFTYTPQFKLLIIGNHKPRLRSTDEAMRRRLLLIPFLHTVPPEQRDPGLPEKLRAEAAGILAWAIAGCLDYLAAGLNAPAIVREATDNYFTTQDLFGDWLAERCEVGPDLWAKPTPLFRSWSEFAQAAGERPGRKADFAERLSCHNFRSGNDAVHQGRYWAGLDLKRGLE